MAGRLESRIKVGLDALPDAIAGGLITMQPLTGDLSTGSPYDHVEVPL